MSMDKEQEFQGHNEYEKSYSEESLFDKIKKFAQKAGISVIYAALLLYYTFMKAGIPIWAKATIAGSLGYFISPIDAILDITPIIGFADDLGALAMALVAVAMFIDDEVKNKAKSKLRDWFGDYDEDALKDIESKINSKKNEDS